MNNDINYKRIVNLFNYYIKIVVSNKLKPQNMGTNQVEFFKKFISKIPYETQGHLLIKLSKDSRMNKERFYLSFVNNNNKKNLYILGNEDKGIARSTLIQKLEFLYYSTLIDWFSTSNVRYNTKKLLDKKFHPLRWKKINRIQYNKLFLFLSSLENETYKKSEKKILPQSMTTSFLFYYFSRLLEENGYDITPLIQKLDNEFFENVFLRGSAKEREKSIQLYLFTNDKKNNYSKVYKELLKKYGKNDLFEWILKLVKSIDIHSIYSFKELNKEISYKEESDKIIEYINNGKFRKDQGPWRQKAIGLRKLSGRPKDDIDKYSLFDDEDLDLVEAAHIKGVAETKSKILKCYKKHQYKEVCNLYNKLYSQRNALIIPIETHRKWDRGHIHIYKDKTIYNSKNKMLNIKLVYSPNDNFLPENPNKKNL